MFVKKIKFLPVILCLGMTTLAFGDAATDQEITRKVNDKIGPGWFSKGYDHVNVQVKNGVVRLTGSVKTADDKEKVEREVKNIDGVANVDSQIRIEDQYGLGTRKNPNAPSDTNASYYYYDRDQNLNTNRTDKDQNTNLNRSDRDQNANTNRYYYYDKDQNTNLNRSGYDRDQNTNANRSGYDRDQSGQNYQKQY